MSSDRFAPPATEPSRATIAEALAAFDVRPADLGGRRAAAVVVTVGHDTEGRLATSLTRRLDRMRDHPGQFALPGGRVDDGETAQEAALRELHEELAIEATHDEVLGRLDDYVTRSGYVISPFVVWVGDRLAAAIPNPTEVAELYTPTMTEVDVDPRFVTIPESERPVVQWPFRSHFIHAPTGAVVYQFREVVLHRRATRIDGLEQPVFAWR